MSLGRRSPRLCIATVGRRTPEGDVFASAGTRHYRAVVPVRVRDATAEDADAIADIYRSYVDESAVSFEEVAPDSGEVLARMRATPELPWLVADSDGPLIG